MKESLVLSIVFILQSCTGPCKVNALEASVFTWTLTSGFQNNKIPLALATAKGITSYADCATLCNSSVNCVSFMVYVSAKLCVLYRSGFEPTGLPYYKRTIV
ncbi:hypothetical protein Bpfe_013705 [Biomphalaria pfeifferi]|uniref:Apple domain-containing protein n=1 Tax=Biomphalaria pfeifferi TaxID=112525 RepID=A0AAD8BMC4_BIOPF|nr:hypothetical protein Bpfe_013705 [Biomphalaria pfeifferi]